MVSPRLLEQVRQADAAEATRIKGGGFRRHSKPQIMKVPNGHIQIAKRGAGKPHSGPIKRCYIYDSANHLTKVCPKCILDKGKEVAGPPHDPRDYHNDQGGTDGPCYDQDWSVDPDDYGHHTD
ncbi:hypothetical protein EW146_g5721 [Bondarzewia mesenterica]|uniref:Uncharacterized protein n=1 Tax=Bondarzewia mesenterica TaxID=1095465 RepID=A0A4S4LQN8_9AGAM|nr:hypothetical protein EW146_g5721 [Bondarzewia mesenterica]